MAVSGCSSVVRALPSGWSGGSIPHAASGHQFGENMEKIQREASPGKRMKRIRESTAAGAIAELIRQLETCRSPRRRLRLETKLAEWEAQK